MRVIRILVLLFLFMNLSFILVYSQVTWDGSSGYYFSDGMAIFSHKQNGVSDSSGPLYGFINTKKEIIIPAQFKSASHFYRDHSIVSNDGFKDYGIINKSGQYIVDPTNNKIELVKNDVRASTDRFVNWYSIDSGEGVNIYNPEKGYLLTTPGLEYLNYSDGLFSIKYANDRVLVIDTLGIPFPVELSYKENRHGLRFYEGVASFYDKGKYKSIHNNGSWRVTEFTDEFNKGFAIKRNKKEDGKNIWQYGIVDSEHEVILDINFDIIFHLVDYTYAVMNYDDRYLRFYDANTKKYIGDIVNCIKPINRFKNGFFPIIKLNSKQTFCDLDGNFVKGDFDSVYAFDQNGIANVVTNECIIYIDTLGNEIELLSTYTLSSDKDVSDLTLGTFNHHKEDITHSAISPEGKYFATASAYEENRLNVWRSTDLKLIFSRDIDFDNKLVGLNFVNDHELLLIEDDKAYRIIDIRNGQSNYVEFQNNNQVVGRKILNRRAIKFSNCGQYLMFSLDIQGPGNEYLLYDIQEHKFHNPKVYLTVMGGRFNAVFDNNLLHIKNDSVRIFNVKTGKLIDKTPVLNGSKVDLTRNSLIETSNKYLRVRNLQSIEIIDRVVDIENSKYKVNYNNNTIHILKDSSLMILDLNTNRVSNFHTNAKDIDFLHTPSCRLFEIIGSRIKVWDFCRNRVIQKVDNSDYQSRLLVAPGTNNLLFYSSDLQQELSLSRLEMNNIINKTGIDKTCYSISPDSNRVLLYSLTAGNSPILLNRDFEPIYKYNGLWLNQFPYFFSADGAYLYGLQGGRGFVKININNHEITDIYSPNSSIKKFEYAPSTNKIYFATGFSPIYEFSIDTEKITELPLFEISDTHLFLGSSPKDFHLLVIIN